MVYSFLHNIFYSAHPTLPMPPNPQFRMNFRDARETCEIGGSVSLGMRWRDGAGALRISTYISPGD
jgi:hypothetical protein